MSFNLKTATTNVSTISAEGIKQCLDIESVARHLGISGLKQSGERLQGECPSGHTSKKGMCFNINLEKNYFNCFHCGEGGDVIRLVEFVKEISFREAMNWLVSEFNIDIDSYEAQKKTQRTPGKIKEEKEFYTRASLYELVFEYGKRLLFAERGKEALNYLIDERGYSLEEIKLSEWLYLAESSTVKEYLRNIQPDAKEAIAKLNLNGYYGDNFRLAFPYRNRQGLITGFVKRALTPEGIEVTTRDGQMHSGIRWDSSKGLSKSDLFNLCYCRDFDTLVILEGYPDAMMLPAMDLNNVVAVGQGQLSRKHLEGLVEFGVRNVIIAFDNDGIGAENTITAIDLLLSQTDINVFILDPQKMGDFKDPDEFVKAQGIDKFKDLVDNAEAVGRWMCTQIVNGFDLENDLNKQKALDKLLDYHLTLKDSLLVHDFITTASDLLSIPVDIFEEKTASFREKREREKVVEGYKDLTNDITSLVSVGKLEQAAKLIEKKSLDLKNQLYKTKIEPALSLDEHLKNKYEIESQRDGSLLGFKLNKFSNIEKNIDGLQTGLYIIGAETNVGKTAFLTNLFLDVLESNPETIGMYFSLDDSKDVIINRLLGIISNLDLNQVQRKQDNPPDQQILKNAYDKLITFAHNSRLHIKDLSEVTHINHLEVVIREFANENLFIGIDGLFNLEVDRNGGGIREENVERANKLKTLVDTYNIPIICTGELRKKTKDEGKNKRPSVSDIMETGKFGYNANVVWLLSPESFDATKISFEKDNLKLDYAKNKLSHFKGYQDIIFRKNKGIVEENPSINNW